MEKYVCRTCGTECTTSKENGYAPSGIYWSDGHTCVFEKIENPIEAEFLKVKGSLNDIDMRLFTIENELLGTEWSKMAQRIKALEEILLLNNHS